MSELPDGPQPVRVRLFVLAPGAIPGEPDSFIPSEHVPVEGLLSGESRADGTEDLFANTPGGDTLLILRNAVFAGSEAPDIAAHGQSGVTIPPYPMRPEVAPITEGQTIAWLLTILRQP